MIKNYLIKEILRVTHINIASKISLIAVSIINIKINLIYIKQNTRKKKIRGISLKREKKCLN